MCRLHGRRCPLTADKRHRDNERRRQGRRYRRVLADTVAARGYPGDLAQKVLTSPMSALPALTSAFGLDPQALAGPDGIVPGTGKTHTMPPRCAALIDAANAAYTPSLAAVRLMTQSPDRIETMARLDEEVTTAGRRADKERHRLRDAKTPHERFAQGQVHKDACLDLAVARHHRDTATEALYREIDAARRGAALVPAFTGQVARPSTQDPDPAALDPLAAMGLTEWTDRKTGHLKPMYPATVASRAKKAVRGATPADTRADQFLLAELDDRSPGFTVTSFTGGMGTDAASAPLDGVITDPEGAVAGAVLISREPGEWVHGQPPVRERARALYTAHIAQRPVALTALVGGTPVTVTVHPGDSIDGTPDGPTVASCADHIAGFRAATADAAAGNPIGPSFYGRGPIRDTNKYARPEAERNLAALLHGSLSPAQVSRELDTKLSQGADLDTAVRSLIGEHWTRESMGTLAGVDGETAAITGTRDGFDPQFSDWIETGIVRHDASGSPAGTFSQLHGADPRILAVNGTGAAHVHHITPEMIDGKPRLVDPATREQVRAELTAGQVLVAHNVKFEQKHLHHAIPGLEGQRPWLDTQWIAQHFLPTDTVAPGRTGLKLQHLCEDTGVPYDSIGEDDASRAGAHSAAYDATVMMRALEALLSRPQWWKNPDAQG